RARIARRGAGGGAHAGDAPRATERRGDRSAPERETRREARRKTSGTDGAGVGVRGRGGQGAEDAPGNGHGLRGTACRNAAGAAAGPLLAGTQRRSSGCRVGAVPAPGATGVALSETGWSEEAGRELPRRPFAVQRLGSVGTPDDLKPG